MIDYSWRKIREIRQLEFIFDKWHRQRRPKRLKSYDNLLMVYWWEVYQRKDINYSYFVLEERKTFIVLVSCHPRKKNCPREARCHFFYFQIVPPGRRTLEPARLLTGDAQRRLPGLRPGPGSGGVAGGGGGRAGLAAAAGREGQGRPQAQEQVHHVAPPGQTGEAGVIGQPLLDSSACLEEKEL